MSRNDLRFQDTSNVLALVCYTNAQKICDPSKTVEAELEQRDGDSESTCVDVFETGK